MIRSPLKRPEDARSYALHALDNTSGLPGDVLAKAKRPLHAALYDPMVIGEALGKVPEGLRSLVPSIPWAAITGMRNYIVQASWQIDIDIAAGVIDTRIPPHVEELESLVEFLRRADL